MTQPRLTVVIPTQGRSTLPRALASIRDEYSRADVEIVVVADTHGPLLSDVSAIATTWGARHVEYDAGFHGYGHPQILEGYLRARGAWLLALGDDDEYTPGALGLVARAAQESDPGVIIWRIEMHPSASRRVHSAFTIWRDRRVYVGNVSGQSIVFPNDPRSMPREYPPHSTGDHDFIAALVDGYGGPERITWREEVVCVCR